MNCSYNHDPEEFDDYTCVGSLQFGDGTDVITKINGTHQPGKSDSDVESLVLANQNSTFFPRGTENYFPNLISVNLEHNLISNITNSQLKPHKKLKNLYLSFNEITEIQSDLFDGLSTLEMVFFNHNKISHIGTGLPANVSYNFLANPCVNFLVFKNEDRKMLDTVLPNKCPPKI